MPPKNPPSLEVDIKLLEVDLSDEGYDQTVCVVLGVNPKGKLEVVTCYIEDNNDRTTFSIRDHNYL